MESPSKLLLLESPVFVLQFLFPILLTLISKTFLKAVFEKHSRRLPPNQLLLFCANNEAALMT